MKLYNNLFYVIYGDILLFVLSLILLFIFFSCSREGQITKVIDGDTFIFNYHTRVRMLNIDAPELSQPYGHESKEFLKQYEGKRCTIKTQGKDKYGRTLAVLYVNGEDINLLTVIRGAAWKFMTHNTKYWAAQKLAQSHKIGLWAQPAIEPYIWRKR
jgi:micrococcal nuclease